MKKSKISSIRSKLYEEGQSILSAWADGHSEVFSQLLGISLSWDYEIRPNFDHKSSSAAAVIWLPAKQTLATVSQSLHKIFNLDFKSEIAASKYHIRFEISKLKDRTLFMEFYQIHSLVLTIFLDEKSSLKIHLYPILYEKNERIWLDNFTITYTYNERGVVSDHKIKALYSGARPKNLSDKEKENMLEFTEKVLPSFSETLFALIHSTEIQTLNYSKSSGSSMESMSYTFFIPGESLKLQELILNWSFSVSLVRYL